MIKVIKLLIYVDVGALPPLILRAIAIILDRESIKTMDFKFLINFLESWFKKLVIIQAGFILQGGLFLLLLL